MRSKLLVIITASIAIILSCVETTSVVAPAEVNPNTTFMATINVVDTDSLFEEDKTVCLAILIPEIWSVDSVYGDGCEYSGPLDTMGVYGNPPPQWQHPAPSGYLWSCWETPIPINADYGETGYAEAYISTTDSLGLFQLVFCAGYWADASTPHHFQYEDNPCSCAVEVTPLSLEQETWGHIKSEF